VVNQALAIDPPPAYDADLIRRLRTVGVCGADCSWDKLPEAVRQAWRDKFPKLAKQFDDSVDWPKSGRPGWINYTPPGSKLGGVEQRNYPLRAAAIAHGLGMLGLAPAEAAYAAALIGSDGQALVGSKHYRLHIPPGGIPSDIFWSVTLYEFKQGGEFLTDNPRHRYLVGSRAPGYIRNPDGSIDVWIQATPPAGDKAANWLPAPANGGRFWLFARSYGPKPIVLDGKFSLPAVEVVP